MITPNREGLWDVSPLNFSDEVRAGMNLPESVSILDVTLREGRQVDGVSLSRADVVEVARRLGEAGVSMIEMHHDEPAEMQEVKKLGLDLKVQAIVHPLAATTEAKALEAVQRCQDNGADIVCFAFALSTHGFPTYKLGGADISPQEALDLGATAVAAAKGQGATVSCNLLDIGRVELEWLKSQATTLAGAGADIIRLDDIASPCSPAVITYLTREIKNLIPDTPIAMHVHNDFGLASALALAALEGGAEIIEASVNGLGERCGVPNLAELVVAVELLYGLDTGIDMSALTKLSQFVADVFNRPMSPTLPVAGELAFAHAIEGHHLFPDNPFFHNPFTAQLVGNSDYVPLCNYSGPYAVRHKCHELGLEEPSHDVAAQVAARVKKELRLRRHPISDEVFTEFVRSARNDYDAERGT
jgi:isopropylmalate/homocitrate/citramalate synthase